MKARKDKTMKRTLLTLIVAFVGVCMTIVSCTSSDEDPIIDSPSSSTTPSTFSFPAKITHSMGADESKSISIEPNAMWEISLSKTAAAHFYIADGDYKRQNMRGEAGKFSVEIKTTSTIDFDNDIACEVTMTMKDGARSESKVIAELTKSKAQREVMLYAAQVENGSFVEQEDEDGLHTLYNTDAVDSDGIFMVVSKEDIDDIEARFKVAANCAWTMILPEWLEANAIEGNASAEKEISLKVRTDLLPENVYSGNIEFIATENETSIKVVEVFINSDAITKKAEVYPAVIADGEYVVKGENDYEFSADQVSDAGHAMRVNAANITEIDALFKVVTNFKWNIEAPEWIKPIEDQEVGESVVRLDVDYSKLPNEGGVDGELKIIDIAKSKAISTVKLTISAEELTPKVKIYPAMVEDGEYLLPEGESEFVVSYSSDVVSSEVPMIWPLENAWADARLKVESNLPLNLVMAEWLSAGAELVAGVNELQLRADNTKLPKDKLSTEVKFVDAAKNEERVISSVNLSYPGIDSFFLVSGLEKESLFDVDGVTTRDENPVNFARASIRSTRNGVQIWLVSLGVDGGKSVVEQNPEWITTTFGDWDGDEMVQSRNLDIAVAVNEGVAREAYLYIIPSSVEVKDAKSFFVMAGGVPTGKLEAKYDEYLATTIKQEAAALVSSDLFSATSLGEHATLSTIKTHWLTWEMPTGVKPTEIYNLIYSASADNDASLYTTSKEVDSFSYYCGNQNGDWVATDLEDSWVKTQVVDDGFKIIMDITASDAANSIINDNYQAGILIKFTDGTYALVVCTFTSESDADGDDEDRPLISYNWPDHAKGDNSTLVELKSGALYDKYKSYGAPIFHLTYVQRISNLSMLTGINYNWEVEYLDGCEEWLSYEGGEEFQTIFMNACGTTEPDPTDPIVTNNVTGTIVFRSGNTVMLVLICTLAIPEE